MKKIVTIAKRLHQKSARKNGRLLHRLMKLPYTVELRPLVARDGGGYHASIPLLKGCQSDGSTPDDAIKNLREAQKAWFESALKHRDPIPVPQ